MKGLQYLSALCVTQSPGELRKYNETYFVGDDEVSAYRYCVDHVRNYSRLPELDTLEEETGIELPEAADSLQYYENEIIERKLYNDIRDPYQDLREALSDQNIGDARSHIERMAALSRSHVQEADLLSAREVGHTVWSMYQRNHRVDGLIGVPSGWGHIDEDTAGWIGGDLIAFVARPGTGKTWLMLYQVLAARQHGSKVLVVNMEMTNVAMAGRFYSMVANINHEQMRRGVLSSRDADELEGAILRYNTDEMLHWYQGNLGQGTAGLEAVISEIRPDVVFIDGVYMMRSARVRANAQRNEQTEGVLDDLKTTALRRDVPIVITSQFNREGRGNSGSLENIGYTDAFSQHCSIIYAIQRPERGAPDRQTRVLRNMKMREGEAGRSCAVHFKFSPVNFRQARFRDTRGPQNQDVDLDYMV